MLFLQILPFPFFITHFNFCTNTSKYVHEKLKKIILYHSLYNIETASYFNCEVKGNYRKSDIVQLSEGVCMRPKMCSSLFNFFRMFNEKYLS